MTPELGDDARALATSALRAMFEGPGHDAVSLLAEDGRILAWSSGAAERSGFAPEAVIGRSIVDLSPETARREVEAALDNARKRGEDRRTLLVSRPDGQSERALVVLQALREGKRVRGFLRTEQGADEAAGETDEEGLLDAVVDGVLKIDADGDIVFANAAAGKLLGWPPEELLGRKKHATLHHSHADGTALPLGECRLESAIRAGQPVRGEDVFFRRDGTSFPVQYAVVPLRHPGATGGSVLTFVDVTMQRRAGERERQLVREHAARVEAENSARSARLLAEAGRVLGAASDEERALRSVAELLVPALADVCLVDRVTDDGAVRRVGAMATDPAHQEALRQVSNLPASGEPGPSVGQALETGKTVLHADASSPIPTLLALRPEDVPVFASLEPTSAMVVPLETRGHVVGVFTLLTQCRTGRRYRPEDIAPVEELAARTAFAVDNLRLNRSRLESEEQFRALFEHATFGIFLLDRTGRYVDVNPAFCRLVQRSREELRALTFRDISSPEDLARGPDYFAQLLAGHLDQYVRERRYVRSDGQVVTCRLTTNRMPPNAAGIVAFTFAEDITAAKAAEARLRLFESVVVNARDAVLITEGEPLDLPGPRIVYANPAFERMTGYRLSEVEGRTPRVLQGDETDRESRARMRRALVAGEPITIEVQNHGKDGTPFWVEVGIVPVRDDEGRIVHWVAIQRDTTERRQAEANRLRLAREEAQRLEAETARRQVADILESLSDAFFAFDGDCRFTYVNREGERLLERRRDELLGRSFHELDLPVLSRSRLQKECESLETLRTARSWEEYSSERGLWLSISATPTGDGLVVSVRDVTELRKATSDQQRLSDLIEASPDIVVSTDRLGRALYVNRAGRRALGLEPTDPLSGVSLGSFHPPEMVRRLLDEGVPAAVQGGAWITEAMVLTHDGRHVPVSQLVLAHRADDGELQGLSAFLRDISDRQRVEQGQRFLSEATHRLVASLEYDETLRAAARIAVPSMADLALVYIEEDGEVRIAATARLADHAGEPLEGLEGTAMTSPGPVGARAVLETGEPELVPHVTDAWLWGAMGNEAAYAALKATGIGSALIVPLVARGRRRGGLFLGRSAGRMPFARDDVPSMLELGARAALAIDNALLYQTSQRATRARDEVLRIVSHDLRNPVAAISLAAGSLQRHMRADEGRESERRQLETIRRSADRAFRLIQDLLDQARLDVGRMTLEIADVSPAEVVREVLELHRPIAEEQKVRLHGHVEEDVGPVRADRHRLGQVLANLLGNSLKLTPSGGHVDVQVTRDGDTALFAVRDTGPGISEEELPHLFDRFWQGKRPSGGAGLGLAIVKAMVEAHGGRLWVESTSGAGATFFFALPLARKTAS